MSLPWDHKARMWQNWDCSQLSLTLEIRLGHHCFFPARDGNNRAGRETFPGVSLSTHSGALIIWPALVLLTWVAFVLSCAWAATSLHLVAHACPVSSNYLDVHSVVVITSLLQKGLSKFVSTFLLFVPCWDTATWLLLSSLYWICLS